MREVSQRIAIERGNDRGALFMTQRNERMGVAADLHKLNGL